MKNHKVIGGILVALLSVVLLFFGTVLYMIISPGSEVFGVRYVSGTASNGLIDEIKTLENMNNPFSVVINSKNVPIKIKYETSGNVGVRFYQKFVGFTKTEAAKPTVKIDTTTNMIKVETNEFEKFLVANDESFLIITVPAGFKNTNFTIVSNTSNVTFEGATVKPDINALSITTTGDFIVNTNGLSVNDFAFTSKYKTVNLDNRIDVKGNVNVVTESGDFIFANGTDGNVTFKSISGSLKLAKCKDLKATTTSGNISSPAEKLILTINGKVNFTSTLGSIDVLKILGEGLSEINTEIGNININFANDLKILSKRGKINIKNCRAVEIIGDIGYIDIGQVSTSAKVTTTSGDVKLGSAEGFVTNADVTTGLGNINLIKVAGAATATSANGAIYVSGCGAMTAITAKTSGTFKGVDIIGNVDINAMGAINIDLATIGKVNIVGKDNPVNINLVSTASFNYKIKTENADGAVLINENTDPITSEKIAKEAMSTGYTDVLKENVITATSGSGKITITIKKPEVVKP